MPWPWVSRELMNELIRIRDSRIENLEKQVAELEQDRKWSTDLLAIRAMGMSRYGLIQPPKPVEEEEQPEPSQPRVSSDDGVAKEPLPPVGKARAFAQRVEQRNIAQYEKDEEEARKMIDQAIADGKAAAEAKTSGGK